MGNILIIFSGVLPFIHILVPDEPLDDKFFGYTSIHRFLYSVGTHGSLLFLGLGIFIIASILGKSENTSMTLKYLRLSLYSPCLSGLFFVSWVFIPQINYNILAYLFFAILILITGILILNKIKEYLQYIKESYEYRELVVNESLEFISQKLEKES
jgi:hypothetical protein